MKMVRYRAVISRKLFGPVTFALSADFVVVFVRWSSALH